MPRIYLRELNIQFLRYPTILSSRVNLKNRCPRCWAILYRHGRRHLAREQGDVPFWARGEREQREIWSRELIDVVAVCNVYRYCSKLCWMLAFSVPSPSHVAQMSLSEWGALRSLCTAEFLSRRSWWRLRLCDAATCRENSQV